jgi:hypothetical protein
MKRNLSFLILFSIFFFGNKSFSQTCCGSIKFEIIDSISNENICKNISKKTEYFNIKKAGEYYKLNEEIIPFTEVFSDSNIFKIDNNSLHSWISEKDSVVEFHGFCGYYLILETLILKKDTMKIGFYNVPAHYAFKVEAVTFKKGNFYFNLGNLSDFKNNHDGSYLISKKKMKKFK